MLLIAVQPGTSSAAKTPSRWRGHCRGRARVHLRESRRARVDRQHSAAASRVLRASRRSRIGSISSSYAIRSYVRTPGVPDHHGDARCKTVRSHVRGGQQRTGAVGRRGNPHTVEERSAKLEPSRNVATRLGQNTDDGAKSASKPSLAGDRSNLSCETVVLANNGNARKS